MMKRISEQAVVFGQWKSLVGIVTQPAGASAAATARTDRPAIVILNTGIIHRIGHNRMNVTLSRILAQAGYTVLRFDFSGIGDSEKRADGLPPLEASLADIKEALDWLDSTRQPQRVILMGFCSGADSAAFYAGSDHRVVGLVLMDPTIPPTVRYYLHYFSRRLLRLSSWRSFIFGRGRFWSIARERIALAPKRERRILSVDTPKLRPYLETVYQQAVDRGIQFLAIFTAQEGNRQTYREQVVEALPSVVFGEQLRLEFFKDWDHMFSFEADRARLYSLILEWAEMTKFASRPRAPVMPSQAGLGKDNVDSGMTGRPSATWAR